MDDTAIIAQASTELGVKRALETKLNRITRWCEENGVLLNAKKTQLILNTHNPDFNLEWGGATAKATKTA